MRLGLLLRDKEYRDALVERISNYDNDIFVNIMDGSGSGAPDSLVLTDIKPSEVDVKVLEAIRERTVFLTDTTASIPDGCHGLFKYSGIPSMISELSLIYNSWRGSGPGRDHSSRLIAVCCESDSYSADKCLQLARQIIYRHGSRVLVIPLSYVNESGTDDEGASDRFSRLMYSISTGRERETDCFTQTDSYGVSSLMLPHGQNRLAYLEADELSRLLSGLARSFDTIIGDIATCFREENISLMKEADNIIFFGYGRRKIGLEDMLDGDAMKKVTAIRITGDMEEAMAMDDCISRIYGIRGNEDIKSGSDGKTR